MSENHSETKSNNELGFLRINVISTGHSAYDHRIFDKETKSLAKAGAKVNLIAINDKNEHFGNIKIIGIRRSKSRVERFSITPWKCFFEGMRHSADIWHFHDVELLIFIPLIKFIKPKTKVIYDRHEDFPSLLKRREWIPKLIRNAISFIIERYEIFFVNLSDGLIIVTGHLGKNFSKPPKLVLYNLPTLRFIEQFPSNSIDILMREYDLIHIGTLSTERFIFLSNIIKILFSQNRNFSAAIIGATNEQKKVLESQFTHDQLIVKTIIPYSEIPNWLSQARIGLNIHPILYDHLIGALPVKVIEYMVAGCSVISSWLPELEKIQLNKFDDGLILIRSLDPHEYAEQIKATLQDTELLRNNQSNLPQLVKKHLIWDVQESDLFNFYRKVSGIDFKK